MVVLQNDTEDGMEPLGAQLIQEHIVDLQREAAASRRTRAASEAARHRARPRAPRVAARWIGSRLVVVATRLDPSLRRPYYGRE